MPHAFVPGRATVVVSGAPGAGKTSLARPLAAALGFTLLAKDDIKETLHDTLGAPPGDDSPSDDDTAARRLAWSRRLGGAAMELLWALAPRCPRVVLEANFRPHSARERHRIGRLARPLVEVYCACPPAECARRYAERAATAHPTHVLRTLPPELLAEFDAPVGIGPVVTVDTTRPVDVEAVTAEVRALLARPL